MSSRRILLPPGLAGVRVHPTGTEDLRNTPGYSTDGPSSGDAAEHRAAGEQAFAARRAISVGDIKDLQRKAFDRGRDLERSEVGDLLRGAAKALTAESERLARAREGDRAGLEDFAVKLACTVAEVLVGRAIEDEQHDVRGIVQGILDEALPDVAGEEITIRGHPDDLARLSMQSEHWNGGSPVKLVPDPHLRRGEFRAKGGDVEYYTGVQDRLLDVHDRLLAEVKGRHAS